MKNIFKKSNIFILIPESRLLTSQETITTIVPAHVVAFYVDLTNIETNTGLHHVILYDHVVTNSGNGHNKHSGPFTVPQAGMYLFSWTTFVDPHSNFQFELNSRSIVIGLVKFRACQYNF